MFCFKLSGYLAVRTGIEPVSSDRQSEIIAFIPTNHDGDLRETRTQHFGIESPVSYPLDEETIISENNETVSYYLLCQIELRHARMPAGFEPTTRGTLKPRSICFSASDIIHKMVAEEGFEPPIFWV